MGRFGKFIFSFLLLIILGYGALVWFVNSEVEKGINAAVADVDGLSLSYDDMWVDIGDHTVTITKPVSTLPTGEHLSADELVIYAFDERHDIPYFLSAAATGMVVSAADAQRMGLNVTEDLHGDMVVDYRYNPQDKALTITRLSFDDARLGKADVSGTVTELDLDAFSMEKLIGLHIKDAALEFTDRSYLDGMFSRLADSMGRPVESVRKQVSDELQVLIDSGERQGKKQAAAELQEFKTFVENSGTVTIKATPERPVPYLYLFMGRDIYDNFDLLDLSIKAGQGE